MPLYTALIMKRTTTMRLRLLLLLALLICLGVAFPQRLQAQTEVAKLLAVCRRSPIRGCCTDMAPFNMVPMRL